MNNMYDVLEICLQDLEKGEDLDTVLFRYPEFAEELRPILETSVQARSLAIPDPSADVVRRNRAKVFQQAALMREAKAPSSRRVWSVPLRRALVSLAVIAVLFMSSTQLVGAASTTLPGDNLYPVKRTWEDVRVLLTFNTQAREALEVEHENERLEELNELFAKGRSAKVDFAGTVTRQNGDLWLVSKIPVLISAQTDLRDASVGVGDAIRVRGFTQADGSVLAERVELLPAGIPLPEIDDHDAAQVEDENPENTSGNANEEHENSNKVSEDTPTDVEETKTSEEDSDSEKSSLNGVADSLTGTILVVDGQPMNIADAEVKGTPKVGASVKVEGYFADSGVFIVTKIEFLDSDSNGENETTNDNNNDGDSENDSNSEVDNRDSNDNNDTGGNENSNDNDKSGSEDNGGNDNTNDN